MCTNKYLEAHLRGRNVIALSEVRHTDLSESTPNTCNVLSDYSQIVLSDTKHGYFCAHVAKYQGKYYIGYGCMYDTGGASSAPSLYKGSKTYSSIADAIIGKITQMLETNNRTFAPFRNDFMRAISNLKQTPRPIQLTLDLF